MAKAKRQYSRDELWAFVYRANTPERIRIAEKWLKENVDDIDLWDDLMMALARMSRDYYRRQDGRRTAMIRAGRR